MTESAQPPTPDGPVATEINRLKERWRPLLMELAKTQWEEALTPEQKTLVDSCGGYDAFLKSSQGQQMSLVIEQSCVDGGIITYLELENRRRSEWESKIEARLNSLVVT